MSYQQVQEIRGMQARIDELTRRLDELSDALESKADKRKVKPRTRPPADYAIAAETGTLRDALS